MTRLDLPDGGWAVLANPRKVQERKRRRYIAAMTDLSQATTSLPTKVNAAGEEEPDPRYFGGAQMTLADTVGDMLILCLVREWSFGDVSLEVLGELSTDSFDPLFKACRDLASDLLPDYRESPDPKAPSGVSSSPPPALSTAEPTPAILSSAATC